MYGWMDRFGWIDGWKYEGGREGRRDEGVKDGWRNGGMEGFDG